MTDTVLTLAALSWDPALKGILATAAIFLVLCGSVYLILATNTGIRTGMLIALAGFFGWMVILGIIWTIYGKGVADQGRLPSWEVVEVNEGDLSEAATEEARDIESWDEVPAAERGEAQASAEAVLVGEEPEKYFAESSEFVVVDARRTGGEDYGPLGLDFTPFNFLHKPHYTVIQVQKAKEVDVEVGETPPPPEADESEPVISVVLLRDLGNLRQRPFALTVLCLILFGIVANALHRRDKLEARHRAEATTEG